MGDLKPAIIVLIAADCGDDNSGDGISSSGNGINDCLDIIQDIRDCGPIIVSNNVFH